VGSGALKEITSLVEDEADQIEHADDSLLVYTSEADAVIEKVRGSGVTVENSIRRQASLEDVFLKLTGRRLIE
jgi:lipooligosaccharide transport system ATP-binding protein